MKNIILSFLLTFLALPSVFAAENEMEYAYTGDVIRLDDDIADDVLRKLTEAGGECLYHRDELYLLVYPLDFNIQSLISESERSRRGRGKCPARRNIGSLRRVGEIGGGRQYLMMEQARRAFGADKIISGEGLPRSFDGSGVVVGFADNGFDATHSNFLTTSGEESRVKLFVNYNIRKGVRDILDTPEAIREYVTDTEDNYHATHVAGIMAGRGTPDGRYMGMAPGAEIVATTSTLLNVEILAGVEDIIAYAGSVGKPAVINLSLGSYGGPHDGTSLFCQYLDKCADDAIICLSTGNEGLQHNHIGHTFSRDGEQLIFRPSDETWDYLEITGSIDIYAADATPLRLGMAINDSQQEDRPVVYATPIVDFTETPEWMIVSDPKMVSAGEGIYYDPEFARYFDGVLMMAGEVDEYNGRYHLLVQWDATTDMKVSESKPWGRYQLSGILEAPAGTEVDLYADGIRSSFKEFKGVKGDSENSFSDLCSGRKTISVGAYLTAEKVPTMSGTDYIGGTPFDVCGFSSYGVTPDGRVIPAVIAPGAPIVASFSGAFVAKHGVDLCAFEDGGYYWGLESGTSMSSPYVAGGIATWLQADPTLTVKDVQEILALSNRREGYAPADNPRHGEGAFDPYQGLKIVLQRSGASVEEILGTSLFAEFRNGILNILNPDNRDITVEVFSSDGIRQAVLKEGMADNIMISAENLNPSCRKGIMLCRISAPGTLPKTIKIRF